MSNHPKARKAGTSKAEAQHKKALFVEAMISNGGNQTQAAESAGYKKGAAAEKAGLRLSKDVWVLEALAERRAQIVQKAELKSEDVIRSLIQAINFDPRKLYREDGSLKPLRELDDDTAMALSVVEISVTGGTVKYRWQEKNAARDQANKILGHYKEDNKQQVDDSLARLLREIDGKTRGLP